MRNVEIIRATVAGGRRVGVGEVVEVPEFQAVELINMGKAVPIVDEPGPVNREAEAETKLSKRDATKKKTASAKSK
jgi:hypothetical protein